VQVSLVSFKSSLTGRPCCSWTHNFTSGENWLLFFSVVDLGAPTIDGQTVTVRILQEQQQGKQERIDFGRRRLPGGQGTRTTSEKLMWIYLLLGDRADISRQRGNNVCATPNGFTCPFKNTRKGCFCFVRHIIVRWGHFDF
jgi:hypothetical protein